MSLIKTKQTDFINWVKHLFGNKKFEPFIWYYFMTKKGKIGIQNETDYDGKILSYYVKLYGIHEEVSTTIHIKKFKRSDVNAYLVCGNYYLQYKMNMLRFNKKYKDYGKRMREQVEHYYNNIWLSLPLIPDIKRLICNYL